MYRTNYTHKTNSTFAGCEQYVRANFTYAYAPPAYFPQVFHNLTACWTVIGSFILVRKKII